MPFAVRLSIAEAQARGDADLALFKSSLTHATYATRDRKTRSGKTVTVNFAAPTSVVASLKIVRVTIDQIDIAPDMFPLYSVEASSVKFSFEDLLRRVRLGES